MRTRTLVALSALSVIACAKLADLETSGTAPGTEEAVESPTHLAGDVVISPTSLEFGPVACGTKATPQVITLRNTTGDTVPYEAKLPEGSGFILEGPASGEIPPNGTVTIPVTVQPTSPSDVSGGIVISAGNSFVEVVAHGLGRGAVLEFVPNLVDFGQVRLNETAVVPVELKNTGSAAATVTAFQGKTDELDVSLMTTLTIPPGASAAVNASFRAPSAVKTVEAVLTPTASSAVCTALPELKLRGAAIDTNITLSVADFGTVPCNAPSATREVTISNFSPMAISLKTATLSATSRFEVVTELPLDVSGAGSAAPSTAKLVVRAKAVGLSLGVFEEPLSLTFDGADPPQRETMARIDVRGAILEIAPSHLEFRSNGRRTDTKRFPIKNTGNAPIVVTYDFARTQGPAAWFPERGSETLNPAQNAAIDLGFRPSYIAEHRATLTPRRVSGATACTPMPVASARGIVQ